MIVSFLWPKNHGVLIELARRGHRAFAVGPTMMPSPQTQSAIAAAGAEIVSLVAHVPEERRNVVALDARARAQTVRGRIPGVIASEGIWAKRDHDGAIATLIGSRIEDRLADAMLLVEALATLHETRGVEAVLVNETETETGRLVPAWARAYGVPVVALTHGANLNRYYTVTDGFDADRGFVFGERGTEPMLDMGRNRADFVVTGNPAWDMLPAVAENRPQIRDQFTQAYKLRAGEPVVLFATTWFAKLTALGEADLFEKTLAAFFRACALLRSAGVTFNTVVKTRPSNTDRVAERIRSVAAAAGFDDFCLATGEMGYALCAADVLVGYDTNAFLEAAILGVPSINLWSPSSWLQGPAFAAGDGITTVSCESPERLASELRPLVADPSARAQALARIRSRVGALTGPVDGQSAVRVATEILRAVPARPVPPAEPAADAVPSQPPAKRYVWQSLSDPLDANDDAEIHLYYNNPRKEVIALLERVPSRVLDVGCGGGATGAAIKGHFPSTWVAGVELSPSAARIAAGRLDLVINDSIETVDLSAHGIAHGSIDTVLLPDVLEHLRDPWNTLVRLKPYLTPDARVIASIPNARNFWLVSDLMRGRWPYAASGLLDITHLRFFTLHEIRAMFAETGYEVVRVESLIDPRAEHVHGPSEGTFDLNTPHITLKGITPADLLELKTFQFLTVARPA